MPDTTPLAPPTHRSSTETSVDVVWCVPHGPRLGRHNLDRLGPNRHDLFRRDHTRGVINETGPDCAPTGMPTTMLWGRRKRIRPAGHR